MRSSKTPSAQIGRSLRVDSRRVDLRAVEANARTPTLCGVDWPARVNSSGSGTALFLSSRKPSAVLRQKGADYRQLTLLSPSHRRRRRVFIHYRQKPVYEDLPSGLRFTILPASSPLPVFIEHKPIPLQHGARLNCGCGAS